MNLDAMRLVLSFIINVVFQHPPQRMLSPHSPFLRQSLGGSLPNVNQMSNPPMDMQMRQVGVERFNDFRYQVYHSFKSVLSDMDILSL